MFVVMACLFVALGCVIALANNNRKFKQEQGRRIVAEQNARNLLTAHLGTEPYFACPECAAVSYSLADIEHGWCGRCRRVTREVHRMEMV